jgi:hypothetical protein
MKYVTDKERREQGADDFLLQCGVGGEIPACRAEEEEVDEAEETAYMCELYDRDHRREWQTLRWRDVGWPRSLHIVGLQYDAKNQNGHYPPPGSSQGSLAATVRAFIGSISAPTKPIAVRRGSYMPNMTK